MPILTNGESSDIDRLEERQPIEDSRKTMASARPAKTI
jgi:nitric oxide reductase activation protein